MSMELGDGAGTAKPVMYVRATKINITCQGLPWLAPGAVLRHLCEQQDPEAPEDTPVQKPAWGGYLEGHNRVKRLRTNLPGLVVGLSPVYTRSPLYVLHATEESLSCTRTACKTTKTGETCPELQGFCGLLRFGLQGRSPQVGWGVCLGTSTGFVPSLVACVQCHRPCRPRSLVQPLGAHASPLPICRRRDGHWSRIPDVLLHRRLQHVQQGPGPPQQWHPHGHSGLFCRHGQHHRRSTRRAIQHGSLRHQRILPDVDSQCNRCGLYYHAHYCPSACMP